MKPSTIPVICCVALSALTAAGISHWWSIRQFMVAMHCEPSTPPLHLIKLRASVAPSPALTTTTPAPPRNSLASAAVPAPAPAEPTHQKDFYEALITKMARMETQNRDLLDQLAETNRDLMKLEFRVDTHSESFRPLPVSEAPPFSSLNEELGVLPPRAEPVDLPSFE